MRCKYVRYDRARRVIGTIHVTIESEPRITISCEDLMVESMESDDAFMATSLCLSRLAGTGRSNPEARADWKIQALRRLQNLSETGLHDRLLEDKWVLIDPTFRV